VEHPSSIELSKEKYEELDQRLQTDSLTAEDRALLSKVLKAMLWMTAQLEAGRLGMARLKKLIFGDKTERRRNLFPDKEPKDRPQDSKPTGKDKPEPKPGHGRNGSDAYTGADKVFCPHGNLKPGDLCPECNQGRLHSSIEPGHFVRFTGQAPITATVYETERLRCGLCGKVFEASLPDGVPAQRWDETAKTMAALLRSGYGVPHYRQEKLQGDLGIPVSDSVLQELSEQVADSGHAPYRVLYHLSAQGTQMNLDDTTCRILDLIRENKENDPERRGIFTTALISKVGDYEIALFKSGRNHMGENIEELLKHRAPDLPPPRIMTDGTNVLPENLQAVLGNCLTHGRRQFADIKDNFPMEVHYVIDRFAEIYRFDAITQEMAMTDEARRDYHAQNSGPVIEALQAWCQDQIASKKCEPNSGLGKAIKYLEKRWDELTHFLRIPGAPLSNDIVERLIKRCVLHRKNSLFYKTQHGAVIGDILMTLIHTTVRAGQNPFDYLTQLQRHRPLVVKKPDAWLPWNYQATLAAICPSP
jgi:transposase